MKLEQRELEVAISNILRIGVILCLIVSSIGIVLYIITSRSYMIDTTSNYLVSASNFFSFIASISSASLTPYWLMSLGVVILMLTPYLRVIASLLYFAIVKDYKYVGITLIVFTIITLSLLRAL